MKKDLRESGRVILAHGEVTGHCHEVVAVETGSAPSIEQAQFFEVDGRRELIVLAACELTHQEHSTERRTVLYPDGSVEEARVGGGVVRHAYPAHVRQGDVYLQPIGPGVWRHRQQQEWAGPEQWRAVAD